jgi:hypothetical protein
LPQNLLYTRHALLQPSGYKFKFSSYIYISSLTNACMHACMLGLLSLISDR